MGEYFGLYRAKAVKLDGQVLTAFIPQVFGDTSVQVTDVVGVWPSPPAMGWIMFHSGQADTPVWISGGGGSSTGGGGTVTDTVWVGPDAPTDTSIELWWDTDEPSFDQATADARYVNVGGDTMTGPLSWHNRARVVGDATYGDLEVAAATTGGSILFKTGGITRMSVEASRIITSLPFEVGADPVAPLQVVTKQYLDATTPLRAGMSTTAGGPFATTGTTELILMTLDLTLAEAARIFVSANINVVQTVATDIFQVNLRWVTQSSVTAAQQGSSLRWGASPNGICNAVAGAHQFTVSLQRQSGTGTASVSAGAFCRLNHIILRGAT